jgi:hypothetical protein
VGERELCVGKSNERKGERGRQGCAGQGRAELGQAGTGRVAGRNPTTRTTTDRNPIANRNPKRDEANTRLNTTSDKEKLLRHDATSMST